MVKIGEIEIHSTFKGDIMIQCPDGSVALYDEKGNKDFTNELFTLIGHYFPKAMKALLQLYEKHKPNTLHFRYMVVSRFLRCNLGGHDDRLDFESDGTINLEFVACPLRGECIHEYVICRPRFVNPLTPREYEVMNLFCQGLSPKQIAETLYIAESTCKKHKQNAMGKVKCGTLAEFVRYANDHNLFGK